MGKKKLVTWDKLVHHVAEVVEPVAIESRPGFYSLDRVCEKVAIALRNVIR
jgi:hypothetical protein